VKIVAATDAAALAPLLRGGWDPPRELRDGVTAILDDVRARGDDAVLEYTRRFDHPGAALATLRVDVPSRKHARTLVPETIAAGLEIARERIADYHERQKPADIRYRTHDMTEYAFLARPLARIGAYVPGGTPLPSSVLMTVVPARVAGVDAVAVATPPQRDGSINPAILFACSLCGVDELYAVGGAQAVGAFAYGTATIPAVDKIVGPGNEWVTEAKRQVFGTCGIDSLAGPSEVLVVCDADARADFVAGELLAQAEHGPLSRVAAVSRDRGILERVAELLSGDFARATGRNAIVERVLAAGTWLIHAASDHELLGVIEGFAPEHLSLQCADPWDLVRRVRRAGAIFVGEHTPVAAGDYIAGTNHTLPTSGASRFASGLRTADYYRTTSVVENSLARMSGDADVLAALADFEALPAHARTARMRAAALDSP
jgi:histidinol dehydrogenase